MAWVLHGVGLEKAYSNTLFKVLYQDNQRMRYMNIKIINKRKQNGMTAIGWMLVIGLIVFFAILAMRTFPIYMEGFKVRGSLESLKGQPGITKKSKAEIIRLLFNRFDIEDIENVSREDIFIEKNNGVLTVTIDYEIRKPIMGNMDIVGKFYEEIEVVAN